MSANGNSYKITFSSGRYVIVHDAEGHLRFSTHEKNGARADLASWWVDEGTVKPLVIFMQGWLGQKADERGEALRKAEADKLAKERP